ncbi:MAG: hypothetical protein VST66_05345, partial [Nitrospirota bacterium]|nr:hypothetical protein [Nitrospirota bacterium]
PFKKGGARGDVKRGRVPHERRLDRRRTGDNLKHLHGFFQAGSGDMVKMDGHCHGHPSIGHPRRFPSVIPTVCSGDPSGCSCSGVEKLDSR